MVSLAAAMIILAAVISVLGMVTKGVSDSRSMIEATNRLRSASVLLRHDLAGATNPGLVMQKGEMGNGYLEVIDGQKVDDQLPANDTLALSLNGDIDDIIMLTTRSSGSPFVGKSASGATVTSPVAEVAWFLVYDRDLADGTKVYNLHRRVFLVCNNVPGVTGQISGNYTAPQQDLSYRSNGTATVPCSLGDLSVRKYRAFRNGSNTAAPNVVPLTGARQGEDIVLTNVLAFDIKVFDPTATNRGNGNAGLVPGDRGFSSGTNAGNGAYVDLGQGKGNGSRFNVAMDTTSSTSKSQISGNPTYDTWSFDYEIDGLTQAGAQESDVNRNRYVNGIDDNGDGIIDDANERDTLPPYPFALRGVQIKLRVYEPSSKQIREVTVEETFVP